jgi:hypothetical protein
VLEFVSLAALFVSRASALEAFSFRRAYLPLCATSDNTESLTMAKSRLGELRLLAVASCSAHSYWDAAVTCKPLANTIYAYGVASQQEKGLLYMP